MAVSKEKLREYNLKYRKEKTHTLLMNFPNHDFDIIKTYCDSINMPVATWVRSIVWKEIEEKAPFEFKRKRKWSRSID